MVNSVGWGLSKRVNVGRGEGEYLGLASGSVVPFTGATALAKPDPFLEELNVVRLEGRYFSFDKHEAKKHTGIYEYRTGDRGIVIETNPRYGQPSIVAYKVLQAVFRKITLEGKPYPETVAFSYHELGRMIGRDIIGGTDSKMEFAKITCRQPSASQRRNMR